MNGIFKAEEKCEAGFVKDYRGKEDPYFHNGIWRYLLGFETNNWIKIYRKLLISRYWKLLFKGKWKCFPKTFRLSCNIMSNNDYTELKSITSTSFNQFNYQQVTSTFLFKTNNIKVLHYSPTSYEYFVKARWIEQYGQNYQLGISVFDVIMIIILTFTMNRNALLMENH